MPQQASAAETTADGFTHIVDESNNVTITGYTGPAKDITIPSI